jgi:UDP-sugar transporter A1/2/3
VLNHALTGLVMGAIVKYLDNIARVYAHSISMIITILVSSLWLSRVPSIQLVLGSVIVLISLHLYHLPHDEYAALKAHPRADHDRHSVVDYDMPTTAAHGLPVKREALAPALHDL